MTEIDKRFDYRTLDALLADGWEKKQALLRLEAA